MNTYILIGGQKMKDVCGKFFHPTIPENAEIIEKDFKYVNLCVYIVPSSTTDEAKICADVKKASLIWCNNCNITLNVAGIRKLEDERDNLSDYNLTVEELENLTADKIDSANNFASNATADKLVNTFQPLPIISGPVITVYYIGGTNFNSGEDGLANFSLPNSRFTTILTDKASPEVLAHEVGHLLFSHRLNGIDPDPARNPNDKIHNLSRKNLMNPISPKAKDPITKDPEYITDVQCRVANGHPLIQEKKFPVGFQTKTFIYLIHFSKLSVLYADDGLLDNDLEATFEFSVKVNNAVVDFKTWKENDLNVDDSPYYPNINLFAEISEDTNDTIHILVKGEDDDTDDKFPEVEQTFVSTEKWGDNLLANEKHTLNSRRNSNIEYSVEFTIHKIASRNNPPVIFDQSNLCFKLER